MGDYSMLDLFRQEVETQVESLKQNLAMLKRQPNLNSEQDAAVRSLHAIAGAAQIVDIEAVANLAGQMKANLIAAGDLKIEPLFEACNLLSKISHASNEELEQWLSQHDRDLARIQTAIGDLPARESIIPQSAIAATEEKPVASVADNSNYEPPALAVVGDDSMLELFRLEVETQATVLNNRLIALETQGQSAQELEALMRSAHSIKGAARIVGLDAAVRLAHVMEDCFVAAQNQTLTLSPDRIDVLFQAVDLLQSLSQASASQLQQWLADNSSDIELIQSTLAAMLSSKPPAEVALPQLAKRHQKSVVQSAPSNYTPQEMITPKEHSSTSQSTAQDRFVRVSAENLNRIIGLAGESTLEANWLEPFANSLQLLKSRQRSLGKSIEALQENVLGDRQNNDRQALLESIRSQEQECREILSDRIAELEAYIRRTDNLADRLYREVITSHMCPFAEGVQGLPRMVRDLARSLNKQVKLDIVGESTAVDRDILKKLEAPLTQILRNAVDHGLELPEERIAVGKPAEGTVRLEAFHRGGMLAIAIADDGKGIEPKFLRQKIVERNLAAPEVAAQMTDAELMEFLFLPGFSMAKQVTEISGRGVGLDIAKSMAQEVGGTVRATSVPGKGTSFYFQLPLTLSVVRTLLVEISGETYAFPLARIDRIVTVEKSSIAAVENRQYFTLNEKYIGLVPIHQVLNLPSPAASADPLWVVIISDRSNCYGLVVDRCLGEQELVVRPLDPRLGKVQDISAAALMGDGSLILILDVSDLVRSTNTLLGAGLLAKVSQENEVGSLGIEQSTNRKRVLVVDDSITVREVERKLLQNRGYSVDVAGDGIEGWNAIRSHPYDLVVSDIDMPRMNGIELIKQIKSHPRLNSIPVIVVSYRDREEDRLQGLEAGADYYLTKNSFHDDSLIQAAIDLIGQ